MSLIGIKALGWGLQNVHVTDDGIIDDLRINNTSPILPYNVNNHDQNALALSYLNSLQSDEGLGEGNLANTLKMGGMMKYLRQNAENPLLTLQTSLMTVNTSLQGHVLLLTPLHLQEQWVRPMDMFEQGEEVAAANINFSRFLELPAPMPPYAGRWMDKETKGELDPESTQRWNELIIQSNALNRKFAGRMPEHIAQLLLAAYEELKMLSLILGFETVEQAYERIVPIVPPAISTLTNFTQLFSHEDVLLQLRPMILILYVETVAVLIG